MEFLSQLLDQAEDELSNTVVKFSDSREMGFSSSTQEFEDNLEKRGITRQDVEERGCECGEADTLGDIVAVSETPNGLEIFCKSCYL